jgi:hypothetical protein
VRELTLRVSSAVAQPNQEEQGERLRCRPEETRGARGRRKRSARTAPWPAESGVRFEDRARRGGEGRGLPRRRGKRWMKRGEECLCGDGAKERDGGSCWLAPLFLISSSCFRRTTQHEITWARWVGGEIDPEPKWRSLHLAELRFGQRQCDETR